VSIRLIAVDIDGTLVNSQGEIPPDNRAAIREAAESGIEVVLVTGRTYHHARPIAHELSKRLVLIVSNGALIKDSHGTTLDSRLLDRNIAQDVITTTRRVRQGAALIFDRIGDQQYLYENIDWQHPNRRQYFERNQEFMSEKYPLEEGLFDDPVQVAFTGTICDMRGLAAFLRRQQVARELSITLTEYDERDFSLLDVTAEGCSKGSSLAGWCASRHINSNHVMAVGDNLNDREMLEFAGVPVVMGNAVPALKHLGWYVTRSHDEGGLAEAIRALAL